MIKRFVWFASGLAAGVTGVLVAGKRVRRSVTSFTPIKVVQRATETTRSRLTSVGDAFREGRDAMRNKELLMKAKRDGRFESFDRAILVQPLEAGDEILVDGQKVEPARVVLLRHDQQTGRTTHTRSRRFRS
ncbi:MAG: hypothetical protein WCG40_00370 [Actinomycetes bacterium]